MGGPNIDHVEKTSQATPFAEDILAFLQGQLSQGAFGTGVGPLQRGAGQSIDRLVAQLEGGEGVNNLLDAITSRNKTNLGESIASQKEGFGQEGSRFSSESAKGESDLRAKNQESLDVTTAQATLANNQQLMAAIGQMFGMGTQSMAPFMDMARLGIVPEEIIASPSIGSQLLSGGISAIANFAGSDAFAGLLNKGQPTPTSFPNPGGQFPGGNPSWGGTGGGNYGGF